MASAPKGFGRFLARGVKLLGSPRLLKQIVVQATGKLRRSGGDRFAKVRDQLALFLDLLQAYGSGEYRDISKQAMVSVAAAVIYFVVPLDSLPDFIFGWGLLDDAAVIGYVFSQIHDELEAFAQWQAKKTAPPEKDITPIGEANPPRLPGPQRSLPDDIHDSDSSAE